MRVIVAGSRSFTTYKLVAEAIEESGFRITELVSGAARGVDELGEQWADQHGVAIKRFPADWDNLSTPDAVIRTRKFDGKKFNAKAGYDRNKRMAEYGEALVAVWDGVSRGTESMIRLAREHGLEVYVKEVKGKGSVMDAFE